MRSTRIHRNCICFIILCQLSLTDIFLMAFNLSKANHIYNFINKIDYTLQELQSQVRHLYKLSPSFHHPIENHLRIQIKLQFHLNEHQYLQISINARSLYPITPADHQQQHRITALHSKESEVERVLNITSQQYHLHEIAEDLFAVQLHHNNLGYAQLEEMMKEYQQMQAKISILENTLINYDWNQRDSSIHASSIDSLMKKAIKYKEVKEENKKLKKLLQNQLQNTEKVREQTQKTMKVLRQEFDTLVKQMTKQTSEKEKIKLHSQKVLEKHQNYQGRVSNKF